MSPCLPHSRRPLQCEQLEDRLALTAQSFADGLYRDVLFRVDNTSSSYADWVSQAQQSGGYATVSQGFWDSFEHRVNEVRTYYLTYLHREPESNSAVSFWVSRLQQGETEINVRRDFLTSQEYINNHNTPGSYVDGLYLDVLQRLPGDSERAFWVNVIAQSSVANAAQGVLTSTEAYGLLLSNLYTNYFNRSVDANGRSFWLNELGSGRRTIRDVALALLTSPEYDQLQIPTGTASSSTHNVDSGLQFFAV